MVTTSSPRSCTMPKESISQCNLLKVERVHIDPKKTQQDTFFYHPIHKYTNTLGSTDLIVRVLFVSTSPTLE